jgi:glycosyltransferase involved in cell wall biosynthesis
VTPLSTRTPKVSVVIPVYNRARYIGEAIASILAQSLRDFELIVVDDGSSDGTPEAVERIRDPRIRLVRNAGNLGIPQTRNRGLQEARGEYIAWLDSDDLALPQRLQVQVDFLDQAPGISLVGSWAGTVNDSGRWLPRYKVLPTRPEEVGARLLLRCPILQYSMMGRAEILKELGYREDFPVCQDFDLFVRLFERHGLANLPRLLVRRRFHAGRVTREKGELVKAMNLQIAARQIEALGIDAEPEDLERHFRLPRLNKQGATPDLEFLEWAEDWCRRLAEANDAQAIYEPQVLRQTLGRTWLEACLYALPAAPGATFSHLRRSPVRGWASAGVARYLSVLLSRRLPSGGDENETWRARGAHG